MIGTIRGMGRWLQLWCWGAAAFLILLSVLVTITQAGDWPTYRHDAARSGITSDPVRPPLKECWVFKPLHPPQTAWGDPKPVPVEGYLELRRMHFDDVFHVAIADGAVYFGSSADNKLYCLDASTGQLRWSHITGGPIRLAPTVKDGRVYVGSDDGNAYCLDSRSGKVIWDFHAAPAEDRVLGHGRMISLWPLRTGVLVDDGVAYFGAGVFPAEGVFLYAVDAATGDELWRNDSCGETPQSKISPQGYLLASESTLYAPMGRVSPSAFDRRTGSLKHLSYFGKSVGGTYALLVGDQVFTGTEDLVGYQGETRDRFAIFAGRKLVVCENIAYVATESELMALDRQKFPAASRKLYSLKQQKADVDRRLRQDPGLKDQAAEVAKKLEEAQAEFDASKTWSVPCDCHQALILAGDVLLAGGSGRVMAMEAATGKTLWATTVEGEAKGLAVSDGRLVVSTDTGAIYCFGPQSASENGAVTQAPIASGLDQSPSRARFAEAAGQILQQSGVNKGYCLVAGLDTGALASELAKQSDLTVYAVDPDPEKAATIRAALDSAGQHGTRVCVECWPVDGIPYSDYFANLIVFESAMADGKIPYEPQQILRMLKPLGGTIVLGCPSETGDVRALSQEIKRAWQQAPELAGATVKNHGHWVTLSRGPLPGAGNWTHLYGNAANTACGNDTAVRCPLGVLWFGHPGPGNMVNRHARAAGPLSEDGRLFVQGENVVMAYDAYNGLKLWEREIRGAMRTNASHDGSNLALNSRSLFIAVGGQCMALDPLTGKTIATYEVPAAEDGRPRRWGYVACAEDALFGTGGVGSLNSDMLFAVDLDGGESRILYQGRRIAHNSIAMADGQILLIDTNVTDAQRQQAIDAERLRIAELPEAERAQAEGAPAQPDVRLVVALDATTGEVKWQQPIDLTHCGGANLASMVHNGVMIIFGVHLDGHYWQQFFAGEFASRRVTALSAEDGRLLWSRPVGYRVRPLVIDSTLHAEPWAFDLKTGEPKTRIHPVTGQIDQWQVARPGHHCGLPVASPNCMFFRSLCLGYYDLESDSGTMHFGAQRPGCWINFIPAAGLLLMPEASAGCMCAFPNMCSVAFKPRETNKAFSYYSSPGPMTPVKRLAINFGAPGDRLDSAKDLWLGFPRPKGSLVLQFPVDISFYPGGSMSTRNSTYTPIQETDDPWLFASAARGLRKCAIPVRNQDDGLGLYTVRLLMCDPDNSQPGQRVFDIKLQDEVVFEDFDLFAEAGGRDRAITKEFSGIKINDKLKIELVAKVGNPSPDKAPILQGVEIVLDQVISLGCALPDFLLSSLNPKETDRLQVGNLRSEPFRGELQISVPDGFRVEPTRQQMVLPVGQREEIDLEAHVDGGVAAGKYPLTVKLVRSDGVVELERTSTIEHLGRRGRVVLNPIEDASVHHRYPTLNKGTAGVLLIDGGNQAMNDTDHALALLKFRLEIPGKPVTAKLQIQNAGNPSGDSGRVCRVNGPWQERSVTYTTRPDMGKELGRLGAVKENQMVECVLDVDLEGSGELSLAIDPTGCDGVDYLSRESKSAPELIVDYVP